MSDEAVLTEEEIAELRQFAAEGNMIGRHATARLLATLDQRTRERDEALAGEQIFMRSNASLTSEKLADLERADAAERECAALRAVLGKLLNFSSSNHLGFDDNCMVCQVHAEARAALAPRPLAASKRSEDGLVKEEQP
jgi:hypothetical protein